MFTLHTPMPRSVQFVGLAAGLLLTISELLAMSGSIDPHQDAALSPAPVSVQGTDTAAMSRGTPELTGRRPGSTNENSLADTSFNLASNY